MLCSGLYAVGLGQTMCARWYVVDYVDSCELVSHLEDHQVMKAVL